MPFHLIYKLSFYYYKYFITVVKILIFSLKVLKKQKFAIIILDTGRYTPACLTEREQARHVSTLVITEKKQHFYVSDKT